MAITIEKPLPDASEILEQYPVLPAHNIESRRAQMERILDRRDPKRLIAIVGPCSAWPMDAVRQYAEKLARLQEDIKNEILVVLRGYLQKPRTAVGWPGPLNQPDPTKPIDIAKGIRECSALLHDVSQLLPVADEMLFTHNADYFIPKLSYLALGARSGEDMEHRYLASGVEVPVGVKNSTGGDISIGVNGVLSVQSPHTFAHHQHQVNTTGNAYGHLILRGGGGRPNYDPHSIAAATKLMQEMNIKNRAIIVDASHDNSLNGYGKDPRLQAVVIESILSGIKHAQSAYNDVCGFMIESFMITGKQSDKGPEYDMRGLSITDPCLGWDETERLLRDTAETLSGLRT